jgi:hypothetical protein
LNSMMELAAHTIPLMAISIQIFAIILFVEAAIHKSVTYKDFVGIISGYRLIPISLVWTAAAFVIFAEYLAIISLLLMLPFLKYLGAVMLVGYAIAIQINVVRGRTEIDCGCGGQSMPISQSLVSRNLVIAILLAWSTNTVGFAGLVGYGFVYWILVCGTVLVGYLFYLSYNQLCFNQSLQSNLTRKEL